DGTGARGGVCAAAAGPGAPAAAAVLSPMQPAPGPETQGGRGTLGAGFSRGSAVGATDSACQGGEGPTSAGAATDQDAASSTALGARAAGAWGAGGSAGRGGAPASRVKRAEDPGGWRLNRCPSLVLLVLSFARVIPGLQQLQGADELLGGS